MEYIERQILHSAPDNKKPTLWLLFIDDSYAIWTYSHDCLHQFFEHINTIHPTIKFEMYQFKERIPFLDKLVILNNNGGFQSTLYIRNQQMSLHYYMHFRSILIVAKRALSIVSLSDIAGLFLMMMISLTI